MATIYRTLFHVAFLAVVQFSRNSESCSLTPVSKIAGLQQRLKQLTADGGMILLDGDNVRGKTKFKLSKEGERVGSRAACAAETVLNIPFDKLHDR